jgi:hypothetical protein
MVQEITFKVLGTAKVSKMLENAGRRGRSALLGTLFEEGEELMRISKDQFVPVDTRNLSKSGFVRKMKTGLGVEVGFGGTAARYALRIHENPRSGKTGGVSPSGKKYKTWAKVGQWKYLITPFKMRKSGLTKRVARRFAQRMRRGR